MIHDKQIFFSRETDSFFTPSGVHLAQHDRGLFHFLRVACSAQLKSRVVLTLTEVAVLRIMLNIDGTPITSKSHTHPSHSQTSRLLTSSLSLGVPRPGDPCLSCFCMNSILGTPFRLILYTTIPVHPVLVCYAGLGSVLLY